MSGSGERDGSFQEHWGAHFARRMAERIGEALATADAAARRQALGDALEWGKEARLRIESGRTHDAAEREGLSHLQRALDEVQASLNRFSICYDDEIREAWEDARRAAECLTNA